MHLATPKFWKLFDKLPPQTQKSAIKAFALLRENSYHPSLNFKKIGKVYSARIDPNHRAIAYPDGDDFIRVWIGSHDEYDKIIG